MTAELALGRADKAPIGSFDEVQSMIRDVFPTVQFGWTQSGQDKLRLAAEHGIELPQSIRESLETPQKED